MDSMPFVNVFLGIWVAILVAAGAAGVIGIYFLYKLVVWLLRGA